MILKEKCAKIHKHIYIATPMHEKYIQIHGDKVYVIMFGFFIFTYL